MEKQRKIQIEIVRIIAMYMIVLGHAFTHGNATESIQAGRYLVTAIKTFYVPGTDIFVLISGYFMSRSKVSIKRIITMWLQILFYSLSLYLIITFLGFNTFSVIDLVKSILPVSFNQYWFMRVYLYMVLCAPFLNILLNNLNKQGHQYLIALGFMLMVIPASIPGITTFNSDAGNGILWFFMLYSTGAYFAKYPPQYKTRQYCLMAFFMFLVAFVSQILIARVSTLLGFGGMGESRFSTFDAFPIYIEACCILCAGIKLSQKPVSNAILKKVVLFFSSSTAGVYMLHEHPLVRNILWSKLDLGHHTVLYAFFISGLIFAVCAVIDHLTWKRILYFIKKIDVRRVDELLQGGFDDCKS